MPASPKPLEVNWFALPDFIVGIVFGVVGGEFWLWATLHVVWEIFSNSLNGIRFWQPRRWQSFAAHQGDSLTKSQIDNLAAFAGWFVGRTCRIGLQLMYQKSRKCWSHRTRLAKHRKQQQLQPPLPPPIPAAQASNRRKIPEAKQEADESKQGHG